MRKWSLSMCEEYTRREGEQKETDRKERARTSSRQTGGRMSSQTQGSVLEQTVTLAPITVLSCWAFLLLLNDFLSGLTRAQRQAQMDTDTFLQRPSARFQFLSTYKAAISFNHIPILFHTLSHSVCGASLALSACCYSIESTAGGGGRALLETAAAVNISARQALRHTAHSWHQPSVRPTSKARGHAGQDPDWGMCCEEFSPLQRKCMGRDRWLNKRQREREKRMNKRSILPSAVQSSRCTKVRCNWKTAAD